MKKLFYGLGAISAVATPVVAVVSCGSKTESYDYKKNAETEAGKALAAKLVGHPDPKSYLFGQEIGTSVAAVVDAFDTVDKNAHLDINEQDALWTQHNGSRADLKDIPSYVEEKKFFVDSYKTESTATAAIAKAVTLVPGVVEATDKIKALIDALTQTDIDQLEDIFAQAKNGTDGADAWPDTDQRTKDLVEAQRDRISRLSATAAKLVIISFAE